MMVDGSHSNQHLCNIETHRETHRQTHTDTHRETHRETIHVDWVGGEVGLGLLLRRLQPRTRWDWRVQRGEDGRFTLLPPKLPSHPATPTGESGAFIIERDPLPLSNNWLIVE